MMISRPRRWIPDSDTSTATYNMIDTSLTTTIGKVEWRKADATADTSAVSGVPSRWGKGRQCGFQRHASGVTVAINGKAWQVRAIFEHGDRRRTARDCPPPRRSRSNSRGLGIGDTTTLRLPLRPGVT